MKIILGYRKEWHFIVVGIGIALGFLMGLYMASEAQFNISEMRSVLTRFGADSSDARIQEMITQSQSVTSLGMTIMLGGIFHGIYLYCSLIRQNRWVVRILMIVLFYPIGLMISALAGVLTFLPFLVYDVFYIIKYNILKRKKSVRRMNF